MSETKPKTCPWCNAPLTKPSRNWMDCTVSAGCSNTDCLVRPWMEMPARTVQNEGDTVTFSPVWDEAEALLIEAWNTRHETKSVRAQNGTTPGNEAASPDSNAIWNEACGEEPVSDDPFGLERQAADEAAGEGNAGE